MLNLYYDADLRTLQFVGIYFLASYLLWNNSSMLLFLPLYAINLFFTLVGAVIAHNTIHCPVFKNEFLNTAFKCIIGLTYGHPVSTFVPGHNISHHGFTQLRRDNMRTSKVNYSNNLFNFLFFMPKVAGDVFWGDVKYMIIQYRRSKKGNGAPSKILTSLGLETLLLVSSMVILIFLDWKKFFFLIHIPHIWAQWGIVTFNMLQHDGCDVDKMANYNEDAVDVDFEDAKPRRLPLKERSPNTSRNFTGEFVNYWFLNNGYHSIHHSHPRMHWSITKDQHYKDVHPLIHAALEQPNMAYYCWRTFMKPGVKRLNYLGEKIVHLKEEIGEDVDWVSIDKEDSPFPKSLSAYLGYMSLYWGNVVVFIVVKFLIPTYSPVYGAIE